MTSGKTELLINAIMDGYDAEEDFFKRHCRIFPRRSVVYSLVDEVRALMFPGYFDDETLAGESNEALVGERLMRIQRILSRAGPPRASLRR